MTDLEILAGLESGTSSTVDHIFDRWKSWIIVVLAKDQASVEEASLVMREVIYAIMLRLQQRPLVLSSEFEAYLTRACRYAWWKMKEKASWEVTLPENLALESEPSVEEIVFIRERNSLLWESVGQLSPECQTIINGVYVEGKTLRSVGDDLGYTRNFTNQKPRRCFKALLKIWSKDPRYKDYFLR